MDKREAAEVMAYLASAFHRELDSAALEVWYQSALQGCDADVGVEVARWIVRDDEWFPTPARFGEVRRAVLRGREDAVVALPPAPPADDERARVRAVIAEARAKVRDAKPWVRAA